MTGELEFATLSSLPWTVLRDIEHACYPADDCWNHYTMRMLPVLHDELSEIALLAGAPVGSCVVARCDGRPEAWILGLSVVPEASGRGIGGKLLDRALQTCRQAEITRVLLTVEPDKDVPRGLYERREFAVVDEDPHFYGQGRARLVMARDL